MASLFGRAPWTIARASAMCRSGVTVSGASRNLAQLSRPINAANAVVQSSSQKYTVADPIKPRPAGETPFIPLVGTSLNDWGKICAAIFFGISAYFVYNNYIVNPEFHKGLKLSREISKSSREKSVKDASHGH